MRVLVTGATGFVGREIVRQLLQANYVVLALARRHPSGARQFQLSHDSRLEFIAGDTGQPASLAAATQGVDAVIHLVGIISELGRNTFYKAHVEATQNVVRACEQAGVRRYVHMSALGTRPGAVSRYHQTKWEAEEVVRASRLAWTILRPSLIYGRGDQFVNMFAALSRWSPFLPVMGPGTGRMQPLSVESVAHCFVQALRKPATHGRTLDLCGPTPISFLEILDTILQVLGRRRWKLHVPLPLARCQAQLLEFVYPTLFRLAAPLNRDQLIMLQENNTGDPSPAMELLGMPTESFRDGITRFLRPELPPKSSSQSQ
jgi:NADH dehydrogenase